MKALKIIGMILNFRKLKNMENRFNDAFLEIINDKYEEKYIDYLINPNKKPLSDKLISILKETEGSKRFEMWKDFTVKLDEIKDVKYLSNPFYIGYGNPNAEILFLGKEKAIDVIGNPEIFFHESINNIFQWEKLSVGNNDKGSMLEFNPLCPQLYHKVKNNHTIKKRDTWGMYAKIVKGISSNEEISHDNFFDFCFTTEVNHIPSKYSKGIRVCPERKELLQSKFYKNFKYVIIGAIGSITESEIKDIFGDSLEITQFNVSYEKEAPDDEDKKKRFITIFKKNNQKIILCNQLSGAAGWSNIQIENLIKKIIE